MIDYWFKFEWEHDVFGVRTGRRKLTCPKEHPNKVLDKNMMLTPIRNS